MDPARPVGVFVAGVVCVVDVLLAGWALWVSLIEPLINRTGPGAAGSVLSMAPGLVPALLLLLLAAACLAAFLGRFVIAARAVLMLPAVLLLLMIIVYAAMLTGTPPPAGSGAPYVLFLIFPLIPFTLGHLGALVGVSTRAARTWYRSRPWYADRAAGNSAG
jgi:hypothetical protein